MTISDALPIQFWPVGKQSFNQQTPGFIEDGLCYSQQFKCGDQIKLQLNATDQKSRSLVIFDKNDVEISSLSFVKTDISTLDDVRSKYDLNFTSTDLGICDSLSTFKIRNEDNLIEGKSDPVNFVTSWLDGQGSGSILIQYKSAQNFAGLISTSDYFGIRLTARFFHERQISTQKSFTTSERIINTASALKSQRKLTIDDMPSYMHRKIQLILAHAVSGSLLIDGLEWTMEDNYELGSRPESYPMYPAEIWLTEKEFYEHNVI